MKLRSGRWAALAIKHLAASQEIVVTLPIAGEPRGFTPADFLATFTHHVQGKPDDGRWTSSPRVGKVVAAFFRAYTRDKGARLWKRGVGLCLDDPARLAAGLEAAAKADREWRGP